MQYNNPMHPSVIELMVSKMEIKPSDKIIEIGCGHGALLEHIARNYGCTGFGIDIDEIAIKIARKKLGAVKSKIKVSCQPWDEKLYGESVYTHAACIGSSGAFAKDENALPKALSTIIKLLGDGGYLLMGELYWKKTPPESYLKKAGLSKKEMPTYDQLIKTAQQHGYQLVSAIRASDQDWDIFESHHLQNRIKAGKAELARNWFNSYIKWGKDCMGFALLLLKK